MVCRTEHFFEPWFEKVARDIGYLHMPDDENTRNLHRKVWEWVSIVQALKERGKLAPGRRGMGFAVGEEPLTSIFAGYGAEVVASDIGDEGIAAGWATTGQHAASLEALFKPKRVDRETFDRLVTFKPVDMTKMDDLPLGEYDFVWSACSLEHLGNLGAGMDFVKNSVKLLKPGGVAVHTTEYNLTSNDETLTEGNTVIYRERDLRQLDRDLRTMDAGLAELDLHGGTHEHDIKADYLPYHENGREHIKLRIGGYVGTSVLLIAQN